MLHDASLEIAVRRPAGARDNRSLFCCSVLVLVRGFTYLIVPKKADGPICGRAKADRGGYGALRASRVPRRYAAKERRYLNPHEWRESRSIPHASPVPTRCAAKISRHQSQQHHHRLASREAWRARCQDRRAFFESSRVVWRVGCWPKSG